MNRKAEQASGAEANGTAKTMDRLRQELLKIMPGYKWTVHKPRYKDETSLVATGTQASGSNRLSTLQVTRQEANGAVSYEVKSSGFGLRAPWLYTTKAETLARALRQLQSHYEIKAQDYRAHAEYLQKGRTA